MNSPDYKQKAAAWAYAGGRPTLTGLFRSELQDFIVTEQLSFEPSGQGEHVYLLVQKLGLNTMDVVQSLVKFSGIHAKGISYAGLKDKQAQTTQWFSVCLNGRAEPDWGEFDNAQIHIQQITRHNKKLKRGAIRLNHFSIILRSVQGDIENAEQRLQQIQQQGVPNYFGEQRFGYDYQNLDRVQAMVSGNKREKNRHRRGMYYSAARSFLFNEVLSERIQQKNWNTAIEGDVMSLDGSRSFFKLEQITPDIIERLQRNDIHPSGPLPGAGESKATLDALEIERHCLQGFRDWEEWLASERVDASRRALRLVPQAMAWQWGSESENQLHLQFELPSGTYATSVLREIIDYG